MFLLAEELPMSDQITEQRRLSALWLNMIAAATVSAGTCGLLTTLIVQPSEASASRAALLAVGSLVVGTVLHAIARALLKVRP
jgi:threonine/homoserine/homoserine lactone efflux protein